MIIKFETGEEITLEVYSLIGVNLDHENLHRAIFEDMDVCNASFKKANLRNAVFDRANLVGTDFFGAALIGSTGSGLTFDMAP